MLKMYSRVYCNKVFTLISRVDVVTEMLRPYKLLPVLVYDEGINVLRPHICGRNLWGDLQDRIIQHRE